MSMLALEAYAESGNSLTAGCLAVPRLLDSFLGRNSVSKRCCQTVFWHDSLCALLQLAMAVAQFETQFLGGLVDLVQESHHPYGLLMGW